MNTSFVLAAVGGLLILIGLVGGGFSISAATMPVVSRIVRIPCFIVGGILVCSAILLAIYDKVDGGGTQRVQSVETTVYEPGGRGVYVYDIPSSTASRRVATLKHGVRIAIKCTEEGDPVRRYSDGLISSLWDRIDQGYIPDVYVYTDTTQPTMPNCRTGA